MSPNYLLTIWNPDSRLVDRIFDTREIPEGYIELFRKEIMTYPQLKNPKLKLYTISNSLKSGGYFGYSSAWNMMTQALLENKVQLSIENTDADHCFIFCPPQCLREHVSKLTIKEGQKVISMHAWESDGLDPQWVKDMNELSDIIVVTSPFLIDIFKKNGVTKPIIAWNHGVKRDHIQYHERSYTQGDDFYFYTYNAGERRKGWNEVLDAFELEFANEKNVKLIAKNNGKSAVRPFEAGISKRISRKTSDVIKIQEILPYKELIELSHKAHVFLFPSYGEGYGLPVFESMGSGLPCILTQAHRFLDIPQDTFIPVKTHLEKGRLLYNVGNWWRPDLDSLRAQMRWAYENYSEALKIGERGFHYVLEEENPYFYTQRFLKELTDLL